MIENSKSFSPPSVKKETIGRFKNMTEKPVQAKTIRMMKTCGAVTPHRLCSLVTQPDDLESSFINFLLSVRKYIVLS